MDTKINNELGDIQKQIDLIEVEYNDIEEKLNVLQEDSNDWRELTKKQIELMKKEKELMKRKDDLRMRNGELLLKLGIDRNTQRNSSGESGNDTSSEKNNLGYMMHFSFFDENGCTAHGSSKKQMNICDKEDLFNKILGKDNNYEDIGFSKYKKMCFRRFGYYEHEDKLYISSKTKAKLKNFWDERNTLIHIMCNDPNVNNKLIHFGFLLVNHPPIDFNKGGSLCFCSGHKPIYFKSQRSKDYKDDYEMMLNKFDLKTIDNTYDVWINPNAFHHILLCNDRK
eukprot:TRINITY_DN1233_c0_g2_i1.p1 TRINITY_DN1233_c0_g2~~TRINITY_DN1233_c0_g2_i1.p1  ORF type:complete len:327 (+),score=80.02 TRINITY_DN1233_c0_g2_i1:136-981(+)